ncbi:CYTH domain-containing protein [Candidatus Saccharibacteria bacterium]|nr:CYTH domain-containing protein [Candidatus Saccharibacteria bacterium]
MKRVVVKVKLPNRADFVGMLKDIDMEFSEAFWQHDRVFVPKGYDRDKGLPKLALRTIVKDAEKPAAYALVLRRHIENKGVDVVNFTTFKDYTEMAAILYQMGFEIKYEVSRQRQELNMGDNVKIYLDKIDGLPGYYAKIESNLLDEDEPEDVREDLTKTFEVLKVGRKNVIDKNYGELMEENNG